MKIEFLTCEATLETTVESPIFPLANICDFDSGGFNATRRTVSSFDAKIPGIFNLWKRYVIGRTWCIALEISWVLITRRRITRPCVCYSFPSNLVFLTNASSVSKIFYSRRARYIRLITFSKNDNCTSFLVIVCRPNYFLTVQLSVFISLIKYLETLYRTLVTTHFVLPEFAMRMFRRKITCNLLSIII